MSPTLSMKTKHHTRALCDHTYGHTCFPKVVSGALAAHLVARSLTWAALDPTALAEPFPLLGLPNFSLDSLVSGRGLWGPGMPW